MKQEEIDRLLLGARSLAARLGEIADWVAEHPEEIAAAAEGARQERLRERRWKAYCQQQIERHEEELARRRSNLQRAEKSRQYWARKRRDRQLLDELTQDAERRRSRRLWS
jgi:hypothetical protein